MAHLHLLVRARGVKQPILTPERASDFLSRAVALAGMNIIEGPHSKLGVVPGNEGVSSTAILDFSSVNLHEWPDQGLVQFDLYTCGKAPDLARFKSLFVELQPDQYVAALIDRDMLFDKLVANERAKVAAEPKFARLLPKKPVRRRRRRSANKEAA